MMTTKTMSGWAGALPLLVFMNACGYHTGGHADLIPKTVETIAIPAFTNLSLIHI